ncbi:hypothetical protein [Stenotrophomonas sp. PS02298]|uniref:hypothetical protein n=1 Tax=Stenotrophomonas sp. PS02298 TaxID=2991424 RepID=UPI00249A0252|nr:hypothetical protein [Stenotrophomonas sp. PS02298]
MQVVVILIVVIIALLLLAGLLYIAAKGARFLGKLLLMTAIGIPMLAGKSSHAVSGWMGASWLADPILFIAASLSAGILAVTGLYIQSAGFAVIALMGLGVAIVRQRTSSSTRRLAWQDVLRSQRIRYDVASHVGLWLTMLTIGLTVAAPAAGQEGFWLHAAALTCWLVTIATLVFTMTRYSQLSALANQLERTVRNHRGVPLDGLIAQMGRTYTTLGDELPRLVRQHVAFATLNGRMVEVELNGRRFLFCAVQYSGCRDAVEAAFIQGVRYPRAALQSIVKAHLALEHDDGADLLVHHLRLGEMHQFEDGRAFVPYVSNEHLLRCSGCGSSRWLDRPAANDDGVDWFCSRICQQTDRACLEIHQQEPASFLNDAVVNGFVLMGGTDAWVANHKLFAAGGQGHGHAAEVANTYLDRLKGRFAKVVGNNNAKNGADRLVDGELLQTKYCRSAAKSVNQAFDNKNTGDYRYYAADGTPMKLEVPADQYQAAVKHMEAKIQAGKVPGVDDPAAAKELVVQGGTTYEQAKNIVRFGRLEGLAFDVVDGAVVGISAASVSFCLSAALIYWRNGDGKAALQAAGWQAAKVGATTMGSYVAIQQLHRVAPVQALLKTIDVSGFPPTLQDMLATGMGVKKTALNRALGGVAVSSVVAIGMASAPDIYRMMRKEITAAQLKRTVVGAAAGTAGAFVGSVIGGAIGAPVGPLGLFIGRAGGGILGGMAGSFTADWFFAEQREREQAQANQRFRAHLSYMALTFALTEAELQVTVRNFMLLSNKQTQQRILSGEYEGRAYLNSLLKPLVVGVVKQRDSLKLGAHVVEAELAGPLGMQEREVAA